MSLTTKHQQQAKPFAIFNEVVQSYSLTGMDMRI